MNDNPYAAPQSADDVSRDRLSRVRRAALWLGFLRGMCVGLAVAIVLQLIRQSIQ